jgi:hypothetical protein
MVCARNTLYRGNIKLYRHGKTLHYGIVSWFAAGTLVIVGVSSCIATELLCIVEGNPHIRGFELSGETN